MKQKLKMQELKAKSNQANVAANIAQQDNKKIQNRKDLKKK